MDDLRRVIVQVEKAPGYIFKHGAFQCLRDLGDSLK